jgi:O-antigen/teichoic acid export membrane protein
MTRTKNSIKNFSSGMFLQFLNKIMSFIVRTVFIYTLNSEYLGINGLFSNILSILSFAELGIGTAIIYNLYKPVSENDNEKIKSLMQLYKKCYNFIGVFIFIIGILAIPFFKYIINDVPNIEENIIIIYLLYLFNTSVSYFFTYKKSIISVYQKDRIINFINSFFNFLKSIFEIIVLLITHQFLLYLIVEIIFTICCNIFISVKSNKMFPFLKSKSIAKLDKNEKKSIFKNVKSLTIYKLGMVILSGTDNIIISSIINVATVGLCSNYTLIIESIRNLIVSAFDSITSSIGNLNIESNSQKKEEVFYQLNLVSFWIYSFCAIAFIILLNPLIELWLGNYYVLPEIVSVSLAISFWVTGIRTPAYTYRITLGLFEKGNFTPFLASILNLFLSILLGKYIGLSGIFFATAFCQILTYSWIDPYLIWKYKFKTSLLNYFKVMVRYTTLFIFSLGLTYYISQLLNINKLINILLKGIIVIIIPNTIYLIYFIKDENFKLIVKRITNLVRGEKK